MHDVLIVGVGSIGERHVRCFQATGRARVSVCEAAEDRLNDIAERYQVHHAFNDLQRALQHSFRAAVVCTPADSHISVATRCAERGWHLLIEKPLATSLDGVAELAGQLAARQLIAGVAYVYRVHPVLVEMREAIHAGHCGLPTQIVATCGQHFPTYRPAYREIYYADRRTGGGAVQDALTHILDAATWLGGPIESLVADASHQVLEGVDVEDTAHVLARHAGGAMGCYTHNQHQAPNELSITVVGPHGTARFEAHHCRWRSMTGPDLPWQDHSWPPLERDTIFIQQAQQFLDAVEHGTAPPCSLEDAIHTLRINLAVLRSLDTSSWESVTQGEPGN